MNTYHLVVILIFSGIGLSASGQGTCSGSLTQRDLSINNIRARLHTGGDLWWDGADGRYIAPKVPPGTPQISSLFAGSLWMGGVDAGGNLKLAAQTYGRSSGSFDYYTGPIKTGPFPISETTCENWDQFFATTAEDINQHKADLADNGTIDGPVPVSILGWPAKGNEDFFAIHLFNLPEQDLAPFFDQNNNGIYEAYLGDYPLVKGEESTWWVFNDAGNQHFDSGAGNNILQMEIQANAFAYSSDTAYIDNTTFYEFKLIYKGTPTLNDVYLGLWVDPDLGCYTDDYIGCNPSEKLAFVYNGDDLDDNPCPGGVYSYGSNIPILGIKILKSFADTMGQEAPFAFFTYYLNTSTPGAPSGTFDPNTPEEHYNYLTGYWRDGTPFSQGGNGYDQGAPQYPYVFDGSDIDGIPWTECNANTVPADRRFLMSFGPISLTTGDIREFAFAVVWKPDQVYPCPDLSIIEEESSLVEAFYIRENGGTTSIEELNHTPLNTVKIVPNPTKEAFQLISVNPSQLFREIQIFNTAGQALKTYSNLNHAELSLQVQDLMPGMHYCRILFHDGEVSTCKLLIE